MSDDVNLLTVILADCTACLVMYCAAKVSFTIAKLARRATASLLCEI